MRASSVWRVISLCANRQQAHRMSQKRAISRYTPFVARELLDMSLARPPQTECFRSVLCARFVISPCPKFFPNRGPDGRALSAPHFPPRDRREQSVFAPYFAPWRVISLCAKHERAHRTSQSFFKQRSCRHPVCERPYEHSSPVTR